MLRAWYRQSFRLLFSSLFTAIAVAGLWLLSQAASPAAGSAAPLLTPTPSGTATPACTYVWDVVRGPTPGASGNPLNGVVAISATDVWAVGNYFDAGEKSLITHWDGTQWSQAITPNPSTNNVLQDVTAVSSTDVWAVGSKYDTDGFHETLILHWDGSQWSIVPSPNPTPSGAGDLLYGVSAHAADDVWAVGFQVPEGAPVRTLTMHWDGTAWTAITSPNVGTQGNYLYDVTTVGANSAWAVGGYQEDTSAAWRTLTMHWDGSEWVVVPSSGPGNEYNVLRSVDAISDIDVWAVGYYRNNGTPRYNRTLIMRWDGTQWQVIPSPDPGSSINELNGVSVLSSNAAWAVGYYRGSQSGSLILRWDGTSWVHEPVPDADGGSSLNGVSALQSNDVWAVGYSGVGLGTFTAHYTGGCTPYTPTPTGTLPTSTATATPPISCNPYHRYTTSTANIVAGTEDIGNHCDNCTTLVTLPFPVTLYRFTFTQAYISSNGNLQFTSNSNTGNNICFPSGAILDAIAPYWDDLRTDTAGSGVYTSVSGTAPNRILNIEWRTTYNSGVGTANFEVRLYENSPDEHFDIVYGQVDDAGRSATIGVQDFPSSYYTQYSCNLAIINQGLQISFTRSCPSTPVATGTATASTTRTAVTTATSAAGSATPIATSTPALCQSTFSDVPPNHTFYSQIRCLSCRGIISGYADGTFKPDNLVTRGQLAKIVSNAAGFTEEPGEQIFADVAPNSTFYPWINCLTRRSYMSGYPCGSPGEPCGNGDRPYFRPYANATRAQTSKIVANAAQYSEIPTSQSFEDVDPTNAFYLWIERLAIHGAIGGYQCGGPGEPCRSGNKPYFRPYNSVTRGQSAKIVANAFFPGCNPP